MAKEAASQRSATGGARPVPRIAFLGPAGTFTEEALLSQADLADAELVPMTIAEALTAVDEGTVEFAFVPIENSIEGTVRETIDHLVFDSELLIQREVVLPISLNLLAPAGAGMGLGDVTRVVSYPVALGQCRRFVRDVLSGADQVPASSTSDAARIVGEGGAGPGAAAIGTALAAKLYGLEIIAGDIEDHPDNETRFVLLGPPSTGIPAESGHDRTSIVCFQHADRPGSLHAILGQFSARNLNLTKLESRPTKRGLGEYCFIIDMQGHVDDEVVADCLRDLYAQLRRLKFLGSYPAAGAHSESLRRDAEASWKAADEWIAGVRGHIRR
jgi:prephenate dehydratase